VEGGRSHVVPHRRGAPIARFLALAKERGIGVAWAAGIPGTVGAGRDERGARRDAWRTAWSRWVAEPDGLRFIDAGALHLGYRHCGFLAAQ
jgi:UDP-N-acetylenolpyruvoylglucosamine reductase